MIIKKLFLDYVSKTISFEVRSRFCGQIQNFMTVIAFFNLDTCHLYSFKIKRETVKKIFV